MNQTLTFLKCIWMKTETLDWLKHIAKANIIKPLYSAKLMIY